MIECLVHYQDCVDFRRLRAAAPMWTGRAVAIRPISHMACADRPAPTRPRISSSTNVRIAHQATQDLPFGNRPSTGRTSRQMGTSREYPMVALAAPSLRSQHRSQHHGQQPRNRSSSPVSTSQASKACFRIATSRPTNYASHSRAMTPWPSGEVSPARGRLRHDSSRRHCLIQFELRKNYRSQ